jgi:hypothetical protein
VTRRPAHNHSNAGGQAYIYAWNPFLEVDDEETILQLWVVAGSTGDDTLETIEAGWQKAPHNWMWGKDYPHLFLFASKGNYATMQWDNGSWFVQTDHSVDLGGKLTLSSVIGGSQYSTKYYIQKDGASSTGDWWFSYDGEDYEQDTSLTNLTPNKLFAHYGDVDV